MDSQNLASSARSLLQVRDVTVRFGGIVALDKVSFEVPEGGVCGLIGPNGAGKTTLFNCLSRLYTYESGDILFDGKSIGNTAVHEMAGLGVGRTFQNLAMFRTLSVRRNIMVGAHCRSSSGFLKSALRLPGVAAEEARVEAKANELISMMQLDEVADRPVADLPFGLQKRVELARALAAEPRLLLLDEPAAGLNHEELDDLAIMIRRICDSFSITVLLVEHHMGLVMEVSDHIVVLNFGAKIAEGTPTEIQANPDVVAAYLGNPEEADSANAGVSA